MNESRVIHNLEDLLSSNLKNEEKIIGVQVSLLTAPGENYGSIMLRIDIKIKNENTQKERTLNTVGKCIPESEKIQQVFNTQVTYRNEYNFYAQIVPTFDRLLKSKGISTGADFAAPFYGGRLNLDNSELINSDAIILMENLKTAGYITGQKTRGFDLETCKVVLNSLAKFHATGIALRQQEPDTFKKKVEPYLDSYRAPEGIYDMVLSNAVHKLAENGFTTEELDVVRKFQNQDLLKTNINETWKTMIHFDSWTNNFLLKYEDNKPVLAVVVDFQIFEYGTPLDDVMFFLFTSVHQEIFEQSIDPLLDHYFKQLLDYLKRLGVDTGPFTKNSFDEEVKIAARNYEYPHAVWMLFPIMHEAFQSADAPIHTFTDWSKEHVQKIVQVTRICFERGWLSVQQ